jgi:hypothetical protein
MPASQVDESPKGTAESLTRRRQERHDSHTLKAKLAQYQSRLTVYSIGWANRELIDGYQPLTLKDISVTLIP